MQKNMSLLFHAVALLRNTYSSDNKMSYEDSIINKKIKGLLFARFCNELCFPNTQPVVLVRFDTTPIYDNDKKPYNQPIEMELLEMLRKMGFDEENSLTTPNSTSTFIFKGITTANSYFIENFKKLLSIETIDVTFLYPSANFEFKPLFVSNYFIPSENVITEVKGDTELVNKYLRGQLSL